MSSCLSCLVAQLNISYPMLFRLINASKNKSSHAGVLEFVAEEGRAYLPQWASDDDDLLIDAASYTFNR